MTPRGKRAARGLTLLEIIVALTLIVLLLSALLTFFWQTVRIRKEAAQRIDRTQLARQVLDRMAAELRTCIGVERWGFPGEQRLTGDRRSLTFIATALPSSYQYGFQEAFETPPPAQHDLRLIAYELWVDPNNKTEEGEPVVGGIIRTEKKTLNQFLVDEEDPLDVRTDLWSHELGYLEFRYFDGVEWDTKWDITAGNALPQMVQIIIGFDSVTEYELGDNDLRDYPMGENPTPHPDRYSTVVRLSGADRFFVGPRVQRVGNQMKDQLLGGSQ